MDRFQDWFTVSNATGKKNYSYDQTPNASLQSSKNHMNYEPTEIEMFFFLFVKLRQFALTNIELAEYMHALATS